MAGEGGLRIRGASLEARGLTKTFGSTRVVQDVSFKVAGGALLTMLADTLMPEAYENGGHGHSTEK